MSPETSATAAAKLDGHEQGITNPASTPSRTQLRRAQRQHSRRCLNMVLNDDGGGRLLWRHVSNDEQTIVHSVRTHSDAIT